MTSNPETQAILEDIHANLRDEMEHIASQLAKSRRGELSPLVPERFVDDPDALAICAVTVDGEVYHVGGHGEEFTIQSIAKPFVYSLALERYDDALGDPGAPPLGFEPTGGAFDSVVNREDIEKGSWNPMINAGALVATSLIPGADLEAKRRRLYDLFESFTGVECKVNQEMKAYKVEHDDDLRAHAYWMRSVGLLQGPINDTLDLYFDQSSIQLSACGLAAAAATLANAGVNPLTGRRALSADKVSRTLSVMYICGLYDFSGQWAFRVGLPGKSSITGALIMAAPNVMGLCVYSPRLGKHLRSERGVKICEALSKRFGLHVFSQSIPSRKGVTGLGSVERLSEPPALDGDSIDAPPEPPRKRPVAKAPIHSRIDIGELKKQIHSVHNLLRDEQEGVCYQSELGLMDVDPKWFGISAVTVDGEHISVGDSDVPFLIQSISKLFVYGLALEDGGRDYVLTKVDVEPTGRSYDSVIHVQPQSKRPHNPMVNTGALAATSMVQGHTPAMRLNRILDMYRRYSGRRMFVDTPSYISEQNGGDRNWAISYLLRGFGMMEGDIAQTLDLYLQQCSVIVTCRDLAVMASSLANGGVNPITGERAIKSSHVRDLLSVTFTCGMYDFAGEWVSKVGFPAKSGVGGGIIIVAPGQFGLAIYSPPLDWRGNSVRGVKTGIELFNRLDAHIFKTSVHQPQTTSAAT